MSFAFAVFDEKPRLRALLDHFAVIDDPRDARRIAHRLDAVLLLVVCGTMADCNDYEGIAARHRGLGQGAFAFSAPLSALRSWRAGRALADFADEPD